MIGWLPAASNPHFSSSPAPLTTLSTPGCKQICICPLVERELTDDIVRVFLSCLCIRTPAVMLSPEAFHVQRYLLWFQSVTQGSIRSCQICQRRARSALPVSSVGLRVCHPGRRLRYRVISTYARTWIALLLSVGSGELACKTRAWVSHRFSVPFPMFQCAQPRVVLSERSALTHSLFHIKRSSKPYMYASYLPRVLSPELLSICCTFGTTPRWR